MTIKQCYCIVGETCSLSHERKYSGKQFREEKPTKGNVNLFKQTHFHEMRECQTKVVCLFQAMQDQLSVRQQKLVILNLNTLTYSICAKLFVLHNIFCILQFFLALFLTWNTDMSGDLRP